MGVTMDANNITNDNYYQYINKNVDLMF